MYQDVKGKKFKKRKESNPLVTVVVLTYKKYDKLKENLNSIFCQGYPNIEIIISDDGSDNFDFEYVENLLKNKSSNIKNIQIIHHEKNVGTVKNFNEAIKKAKGEYIFPLSQDDSFYDENVIENLVNSFGENLVVTGIRVAFSEENNEIVGEYPLIKDRNKFLKDNFYKFLILNGNIISGASTYYKKEVFEKYGYFDENLKLLEDMPFYLKILRNGEQIKFVDIKTIRYNLGGVSTSKNIHPILQQDWIKLYEEEAKLNSGFLKRYLNFLSDTKRKVLEYNNWKKISVYFKYPDILLIKIINKVTEKIFGINLLFKFYKI